MLRRLWNDESAVAAAEYALIVAIVGAGMVIAAGGLGLSIKGAMDLKTTGPDGTVYHCTAHCQYDYHDYCAAVAAMNQPDPPTFVPTLAGTCTGETPVS